MHVYCTHAHLWLSKCSPQNYVNMYVRTYVAVVYTMYGLLCTYTHKIVTRPVKANHASANYTELYFQKYLQLQMWYLISVNFRRKPIKFCSSDRDLMCLYKQFISYDRAKTEKIGDIFVLTWLIFAGPVTIVHTRMYVDMCFKTCVAGVHTTMHIRRYTTYVHMMTTQFIQTTHICMCPETFKIYHIRSNNIVH